MKINYFSLAHITYIAIALASVFLLYKFLRKRSYAFQRNFILTLIILNVFQHLFKLEIYPMYDGGFSALCTAYNMCAVLILSSPIAHFVKWPPLRDFLYYVGSVAGFIAILIPYWNIGEDAFTWSFFRFFICHLLLFVTSLLPLLLSHHKPSWKCFWRIGIGFFIALLLILINDVLCLYLDIYAGLSKNDVWGSLAIANPCWTFGPPESFSFVLDIVNVFSPDYFVFGGKGGAPIPILWYLIPLYIGITLVSFPICALFDKENFKADMKRYKTSLKELFGKKGK